MESIRIELTKNKKVKPKKGEPLPFGRNFTDHMFVMDYDEGMGWHDARIVPYAPLSIDPACMCLHYGQTVFEGMKAYRTPDDRILMFRPDKNIKRLNLSNERLCIPQVDEEFCINAIAELVNVDKDWVPHEQGASLYIRPFIIAVDPYLGVHTGKSFKFIVICDPVGSYYKEGINPVKIYVEQKFVRAVKGGMGFAKTGGNYAASLKAQDEAEKQGYTQVLWLDGVERRYIEEVGTMNVFFVINGKVVTPALQGSILGGVTRMSCVELLKSRGYDVEERPLSIDEVAEAYKNGTLDEVFGTGTAAVISPVGELKWNDMIMKINDGKIGKISQELYDGLTGIQWGRNEDLLGWTRKV